ncbi:MAG TPA: hypothetical protein VNN79_17725 [Actinomycetota bacterium]|nr:hypothetical protein [Actinomycetota bacterium]
MGDQWDPFGPTDDATPDIRRILARAQKTRLSLHGAQVKLTGMRHGPGPDNTPPVVQEVSRTDGLWPYLLIRTYAGDSGKRPIEDSDAIPYWWGWMFSPDVFATPAGPPGEPRVVGRDSIAALKAREVQSLPSTQAHDVWVHVWNLGHFQATGVRVRARLVPWYDQPADWPAPPERFLGGSLLDLDDRLGPAAHKAVKVGTFTPDALDSSYLAVLVATAECMTDVSSGDISPGADRHTANRVIEVQ